MGGKVCDAFVKEYVSSGGMLVIENIFYSDRSRLDVIRELIESGAYICDDNPAQLTHTDASGCGFREKEAGV